MPSGTRRLWIVLFWLALVPLSVVGDLSAKSPARVKRPRDIAQFRRQHDEKLAKFAAVLDELAKDCDAKGLDLAAEQIRQLALPVDTAELRLAPLPRQAQLPIPADLSGDERHWRKQLRFHRQTLAKDLYLISRQALLNGHVGFAYDLIREVAIHDPDHVSARRILGFVRHRDEWVTAFESTMLDARKIWHDRFGWIHKDQVERYERGERPYKGGWISAVKETELRRDFANAWEIRTEHYLIKTNHSLERGVELAKKLEDFHGLFFQLMAGFFNSPDQVQQLFAGGTPRPRYVPKPNVVYYYSSRNEYLAELKNETNQPVEITRGIYFPRNGIAYFFFDPESDDDSTLYHEATHQLLSGSRPGIGEIGIKSDFWVIEGIACYMESFHREGDRFSVGDPGHSRIQAAKAHFVQERYYVPLREFSRMGMAAFQSAREIRSNYSQGAALTHFFLHYDDGRYREDLIEHISQIYSADKSPDSLAELTGVDDEVLDEQYAQYIRALAPRRLVGTASVEAGE